LNRTANPPSNSVCGSPSKIAVFHDVLSKKRAKGAVEEQNAPLDTSSSQMPLTSLGQSETNIQRLRLHNPINNDLPLKMDMATGRARKRRRMNGVDLR
jgi:hypothetical protein